MIALFFGIFAGLVVFSALAVAWQRNLVYSAFLLLGTFMGVAALFLLLSADFLAVTQILIYVGGILTLFLFGVLITKRRESRFLVSGVHYKKRGAFLAIGIAAILGFVVFKEQHLLPQTTQVAPASVHVLGKGILVEYLLPFELAGVLLLVALIGVLALSSIIKTR